MRYVVVLLLGLVWASAQAGEIGIIAFQMSSDTHARTANAAADAARALGHEVTVLNSAGAMPTHAEQLENLIQKPVDGIILAMGKLQELEEQLIRANEQGIPVISVMSGTSPHVLFDVNVNEAEVGAKIAQHLLGLMNFEGNLLVQRYEGHGGTRMRGKILDAVLSEYTAVEVLDTHSMARTRSWREDVRAGMEALLLKHQGEVQGIWASFDGQAFVIDDLLQQQGVEKGEVLLTGVDGGQEVFARIRDPRSSMVATVAIPFELMGERAVRALDRILQGADSDEFTRGPFLYMDAVLVDSSNVPAEGEWPW